MKSNIALSIIIPVYQVEEYIESTISSLVSAIGKRTNVEVIFINDGTLDLSFEMVKSHLKSFMHAVLLEQKNVGLSVTRNRGFSAASGEYVWFVDSDDMINEDAISNFLSYRAQFDTDVFCLGHQVLGGDELNLSLDMPSFSSISGVEVLNNYVYLSPVMFYMYRRDFLVENDLSFEANIYHEDALFTIEVLLSAKTVVRLAAPFYIYRIRPSSIMTGGNDRLHVAGMLTVVERILFLLERCSYENATRSGLSKAFCKEVGGLCFYLRRISRKERTEILGNLHLKRWLKLCSFNKDLIRVMAVVLITYLKW
jgi:glycosyltransferase involved in cell wall biosynthesis